MPTANAVLVTSIMARGWDIEPAGGAEIEGRGSPGHYSVTTVSTTFTVAEKYGIGGKETISSSKPPTRKVPKKSCNYLTTWKNLGF